LVGTLRARGRLAEVRRDHRGAAASVAEVEALVPITWTGLIDSAALLARCAGLTRSDRGLAAADRSRLAARYGQDALALLRRLAPHHDLTSRLRAKEFDTLRTLPGVRESFRRLQDEIEQAER
jgi:hypothetical protein